MSYKALVIGCGQIGSMWGKQGQEAILSHAQAYKAHASFSLEAVVDLDPVKAREAGDKWQVTSFTSIEEAMKSKSYEVVSICASTKAHQDILKKLQAYAPRLIILEKPLAEDLNAAKDVAAIAASYAGKIIVHYTRRFIPAYQALRQKIQQGAWGKFISGHCYYTKGLLHNGSHAIDLVRFLLGEVKLVSVFSKRVDYKDTDPSVSLALGLAGGGVFSLLEADQQFSSIFETELLFEQGRLRLSQVDMFVEEFGLEPHPLWEGYQQWVSRAKSKISFEQELRVLLDHAVEVLENKAQPLCSVADALASHELCDQALNASRALVDQRRI